MMTEEMRVGDRHQRRMQRRRHPPDHVIADEAGQHEDGEQEHEGRVGDALGHLASGFRDGGGSMGSALPYALKFGWMIWPSRVSATPFTISSSQLILRPLVSLSIRRVRKFSRFLA